MSLGLLDLSPLAPNSTQIQITVFSLHYLKKSAEKTLSTA